MSDFTDKIDTFFRISERGSNFRNEIRGGIITFLAMLYILVVNPSILGGIPTAAAYGFNSLFTATALACIISCLLMGLYSRFPVALAPGMGTNAFLTYTICLGMGFTYLQGLFVVLISGILFLILTVTEWRMKILDSIPKSMKLAITAGIGFFIALVGLFNAGIIVHGNGSALAIGNLADAGILLALFCLVVTLIFWFQKWWGAIIVGMLATWVLGIVLNVMDVTSATANIPVWNPDGFIASPDFSLCFAVFTDFEMFDSSLMVSFIAAVVSLFIVDMFDTAGTLIGVGTEAGLIDSEGHLVDGEKALRVDAISTVTGAVVGTSTTTSYIESTTGIAAGARTGLMAVVVGLLFAVSLLFSGFFGTFTSACTVGALVIVGILMIKNVREIDWLDPITCAMAFMTIFMMGLAGSITTGIAAGIFTYVGGKAVTGKIKEITPLLWILAVIFLVYLVLNNFIIPGL